MDSSNSSEPTVDFNAFVATETGLLKAVHINPKNNIVKTFHNLQNGITKEEKISAMGWGNRNEILLGLHNQTVKVFDPEEKRYITSFNAAVTQGGPLRGVAKVDNVLLTAANTGTVTLWKNKEQDRITFNTVDTEVCATGKLKKGDFHDEEEKATFLEQIKTGRTLHRMRTHQTEKHLILTGGKENGLQVWDLTRPDQPMFKAKNVKHDALDLRVPVWITDLCFTDPLSAKQVACTNKYGHIRLYDVRAESSQRRPTMEVMFPEDTPTAMAPTPNIDQVLVGTGTGQLALFDFRQQHKGMFRKFKGCVGSISAIDCHLESGFFATAGLDRFTRVFHYKSKKIVDKLYLKSRLTGVLLAEKFDIEQP